VWIRVDPVPSLMSLFVARRSPRSWLRSQFVRLFPKI
jgi:hypothetical protein